jgi:hypothetical protein
MVDSDLASLYGVTTGNLNLAVKRNPGRFPGDFMFQRTPEEISNLLLQNARSSWGGRRRQPYVFTEHGVAMLSSLLRVEKLEEMQERHESVIGMLADDIRASLLKASRRVFEHQQTADGAARRWCSPPMVQPAGVVT